MEYRERCRALPKHQRKNTSKQEKTSKQEAQARIDKQAQIGY